MGSTVIQYPNAQKSRAVYNLPDAQILRPSTAWAQFDGTGAAGNFLACLSFYANNGRLLSRVFPTTPVTAGDVAEISYAPFPGGMTSSSSTGITDITSTGHTVTVTGPTGPTTNLEVASPYFQNIVGWAPVLTVGAHTVTGDTVAHNSFVFGSPSQLFVQGDLSITLGADTGSGSGDHYTIVLPEEVADNAIVGWGEVQDVAAGVSYPGYLQGFANSNTAAFITTGTTPGGGEAIPWAVRPSFPFTFAAGDRPFVGSFLYLMAGSQ